MYGIYDNGTLLARFTAPTTVESNQPILFSDALSLKRTFNKRAVQRWEITSSVEPLSFGANNLFALFVKNGYTEKFDIMIPQNYGSIKRKTSNSTCTTVASQFATTVAVTNNSGIIPAGTFVKFLNHEKVYMTTTELTGTGNIGIYPPLMTSLNGTFMIHKNVIMKCYRETDSVRGMVYTDGILMDMGAMKFVEAL